jgi:Flp pilus assembly CpaE family ATPase
MMLAVVAAKGAPGATTTAAGLAAVAAIRGESALLVEFDLSGGSVALEARLSLDPGLQSLAAAARHGLDPSLIDAHAQQLPNGARVLVAPTSPDRARSAMGSLAAGLATHLPHLTGITVVDLGRWDGDERVSAVLAAATEVLVVTAPSVVGTEHTRSRLRELEHLNTHIRVVCVGEAPYPASEVAAALGVAHEPALVRDERAAELIRSGAVLDRWLRRTGLARSISGLLDRLDSVHRLEVTT